MPKSRNIKGFILENDQGGYYHPGKQYDHVKKMTVGAIWRGLCAQSAPDIPSTRLLAREAQVSRGYAQKVIEEIKETGDLMDPEEEREYWRSLKGTGSKSLTKLDEIVLFSLWCEAPERSNNAYTHLLFVHTGTCVSESFISKWFLTAFPHRGSFRKPNQIPIDKFRTTNVVRHYE